MTTRSLFTRLLMLGLVGWIEAHLVMILLHERITIYESRPWLLIIEIVAVGALIVFRIESYVRDIRRRPESEI